MNATLRSDIALVAACIALLCLTLAGAACTAARPPSASTSDPSGHGVMPTGCAGVRSGLTLFAAVPTNACATHGPTAAPGGIAKDAAIAAARRALPGGGGSTTVAWASIEHDPFVEDAGYGSRLVWEVRLEGEIPAAACTSGFLDRWPLRSDPVCLDGDSGIVAVLDYFSGDLLGWLH